MTPRASNLKVGIGGLGAIGTAVAKALDDGIAGLELCAVAGRDPDKTHATVAGFKSPLRSVKLEQLADLVDVVIECAPASVYDAVARPAVERGRVFVTMSSGALLSRPDLFERAKTTGARIIVPSGGVLGFDGLSAAVEGDIRSVTLVTRKPPKSFAGAPHLARQGISVSDLAQPLRIFHGNACEAAKAFPANANVAASISLAGIGPERTTVEIWADPGSVALLQEIHVQSADGNFIVSVESFPLSQNPRTGSMTPKSVIAALRALVCVVRIGT